MYISYHIYVYVYVYQGSLSIYIYIYTAFWGSFAQLEDGHTPEHLSVNGLNIIIPFTHLSGNMVYPRA